MDRLLLIAHSVRDVVEKIATGELPAIKKKEPGSARKSELEGWWSTRRKSPESPMSLSGACAYTSRILVRLLVEEGFLAHLCVGTFDDCDHCWVVVEDPERGPLIIDATASQFSPLFSRVRVVEAFRCDADYRTIRKGGPGSSADVFARRFDEPHRVPPLLGMTRLARRRIQERLAEQSSGPPQYEVTVLETSP